MCNLTGSTTFYCLFNMINSQLCDKIILVLVPWRDEGKKETKIKMFNEVSYFEQTVEWLLDMI